MHTIEKIAVRGFKRLAEIELRMKPFMTLIGANGVGKTSLLEAFALLSASAAGRLKQTLSDLGGIAHVGTQGRQPVIELAVDMQCHEHQPLQYEMILEGRGQAYGFLSEKLIQKRKGENDDPFKHIESFFTDVKYFDIENKRLVKPDWEYDHSESSLSQVPKMFKQPEALRQTLSSAQWYHALDVGPRAPVKLPQQMKPVASPGANGEDLSTFLYHLRETEKGRYEAIEDTLKAGFPGFEKLNFPAAAAGMLSLTWKEHSFRDPLYAHQLSEGTLRFLWLVSLLQSPRLPTITLIDEPEVSLHPELLSLLADLMREASARTQLIVATHSDRFVRFLKPHEVVVMDIGEDGYAQATWADTVDLDVWLAEYSLDEIWRMGRMGGRS